MPTVTLQRKQDTINNYQALSILEDVPMKGRKPKGEQFPLLWSFAKRNMLVLFFPFEMNIKYIP